MRRIGCAARARMAVLLAALVALGCGDGATGPPEPEVRMRLTVESLPALDAATQGIYEAWVVGPDAELVSLGAVDGPGAAAGMEWSSPVLDPAALFLTLETPSEADDGVPSQLKIAGGRFVQGRAEIASRGYLTPNLPLEAEPGQHVLGTHGDLHDGVPDREDAGLWLHNDRPTADTLDGSFYVTLTPLTEGWTYEGWVVRDHGSENELWLSYGKFLPGPFRKVRSRDDTGLGVFSGWEDYELVLPRTVFFPGDDWLANSLGYPLPQGLELPVDLNGCLESEEACAASGQTYGPSRWTHVITVEPYEDRYEDPLQARPFFLRPYRNAIGEMAPDVPRSLRFRPETLPRGTAEVVG